MILVKESLKAFAPEISIQVCSECNKIQIWLYSKGKMWIGKLGHYDILVGVAKLKMISMKIIEIGNMNRKTSSPWYFVGTTGNYALKQLRWKKGKKLRLKKFVDQCNPFYASVLNALSEKRVELRSKKHSKLISWSGRLSNPKPQFTAFFHGWFHRAIFEFQLDQPHVQYHLVIVTVSIHLEVELYVQFEKFKNWYLFLLQQPNAINTAGSF